ncbi:hypothetical protein [Streptomyces sp. NPDC051567]|uniref:hypothetical protein n=1 Tax=Streptomyces sp. NPDC051567 TaxID=3365660 RepID=UPI00378A2135
MPFTSVRGRTVELPDTLAGIRAGLPEERLAEFDEVIFTTPLRDVPRVALLRFGLPPEAEADDLALHQRLQADDRTGLDDQDGTPAG